MSQAPQAPQLNIDLTNTTGITNEDGGSIFMSGVILRKISKFVAGTAHKRRNGFHVRSLRSEVWRDKQVEHTQSQAREDDRRNQ